MKIFIKIPNKFTILLKVKYRIEIINIININLEPIYNIKSDLSWFDKNYMPIYKYSLSKKIIVPDTIDKIYFQININYNLKRDIKYGDKKLFLKKFIYRY